jgi:RNase P/RNase MRP subunit p29
MTFFKSKDFQIYDILGKKIKIFSCSNKFNKCKFGIVVNEPKNMIYIKQKKEYSKIKKISKKEIGIYRISLSKGDYFINGKSLLGRPEEKISKL